MQGLNAGTRTYEKIYHRWYFHAQWMTNILPIDVNILIQKVDVMTVLGISKQKPSLINDWPTAIYAIQNFQFVFMLI